VPPNAPFAASNVAMSALGVPVAPFGLGTVIGLAPRTTAVVMLGAGLSRLDFSNRPAVGWFVAGVVATFVALGAIGLIANRALRAVEAAAAGGGGKSRD
jgi:uncharacterized membrane protein YdjX (TVP38/TMEM64 family)